MVGQGLVWYGKFLRGNMGQELSASELRTEVKVLRDWFKESSRQGQKKWMRLGKILAEIRDRGCWKDWSYKTFDDYVESDELGVSKSKAYALLSVVDNLKLPMSRLEELGKSACYELARLGKEKPKSLKKVMERINRESEKGPVTIQRVRTMVSVALEGSHLGNGHYTNLDFLLPEERAGVVIKALKVIQAIEPLENPSGPAARGVHLISICEEYLSGEEQKKVVKQLEKAGGFSGTNFQLEE
jgi:hypothetical protein